MSRRNPSISSILLGLACFASCLALKASPNKPKPTTDDLAKALRGGDWRAGTNLGVEIYRTRKTGDFLEQAIQAFEDSGALFMECYDLNSDGSIDKNEYRVITDSDQSNYPILFYNLGRALIEQKQWDKAGESLRIAAECPQKSDSKFRAMHDYSILVAKNMIKPPKPFGNLGMAFQPTKPRKPMAFEGRAESVFDYYSVLSDLKSKGLKDVSPKANKNLYIHDRRLEFRSLYLEVDLQLRKYKNYEVAVKHLVTLVNEFDELSRPDSVGSKTIARMVETGHSVKYLSQILKKFPDELNYANSVYWKRKAASLTTKIKKNSHRERAAQYEKRINFRKLNPVFREKLKPLLPPPTWVDMHPLGPVKPNQPDQPAIKTTGKSDPWREFYEKFRVKAPPQSFDACLKLENFAKQSLANDKTGKREFYLYLMWKDFSKRPKGTNSGSIATSYKNYLKDSYKKEYPDALFKDYDEKKEENIGLIVASKYRRNLDQSIDKILAHHPDGSLKEYYYALLFEYDQLVCELGPLKGYNQYEQCRDRLKKEFESIQRQGYLSRDLEKIGRDKDLFRNLHDDFMKKHMR